MSTPKYQVNDRVKKVKANECITHQARYSEVSKAIQKNLNRYGTITDFIIKKDRRGRAYFYYYVTWEDSKTTSLHCQNRLVLAEEDT